MHAQSMGEIAKNTKSRRMRSGYYDLFSFALHFMKYF